MFRSYDPIASKAVPFLAVTFLISSSAANMWQTHSKNNNNSDGSTKNNINDTHNVLVVQFIGPINQVAIPWIHLCGVVILRK